MESNQVQLFWGRLGQDPEYKEGKEGLPICTFSIACPTEDKERPDWKRIVTFGEQAKEAKRHLSKGQPVFIQGKIETSSYTNKNGELKTITEIKTRNIGFSKN